MKRDILSVMVPSIRNETSPERKRLLMSTLTTMMENELTEKQKYVITQHLAYERPLAHIAQEMGVNKSTTNRIYHSGLRKLSRLASYVNIERRCT